MLVGKPGSRTRGSMVDDFECITRPELHHWSFDGVSESCQPQKVNETTRRLTKRWKTVPLGRRSAMPSNGPKLVRTFPIRRPAYWRVSPKGTLNGARCPIKCDPGYRLKDPSINEYVCMGPTRSRDVKYKQEGVEKIKKAYHNSFGHLLCVVDRCDLPAGTHYVHSDAEGHCNIEGNSVGRTTGDGCIVTCPSGYAVENSTFRKITCNNGELSTNLPTCVYEDQQAPTTTPVRGVLNVVASDGGMTWSFWKSTLKSTLEEYVEQNVINLQSGTLKVSISQTPQDGGMLFRIFFAYHVGTVTQRRLSLTAADFRDNLSTDMQYLATVTEGTLPADTCTGQLEMFAADNLLNFTDLNRCGLTDQDGSTCTSQSCAPDFRNVSKNPDITVKCVNGSQLMVENAICVTSRCYIGEETHNFSTFNAACDYDSSTATIAATTDASCKVETCKTGYTFHDDNAVQRVITCGANGAVDTKAICVPDPGLCYLDATDIFKPVGTCNIYRGVAKNDSCEVSCIDGYKLQDTSKNTLVCGSSGAFDSKPTCVKDEDAPAIESAGVVPRGINIFFVIVLISCNIKMGV